MEKKYLDSNGLLYIWGKIKSLLGGKVDKESGKGLSTNDYTSTEKSKLAGIASGAEVNVNADWNATTGDAQILNKPTIPVVDVTKSYVDTTLGGKVDKISGKGLSTNDYTSAEKSKLDGISEGAEVNVNADWTANSGDAQILNKPSLSPVAISGSYDDLSDIPAIPVKTSQLTNDSTYQTLSEMTAAINKAMGDVTGISFEIVTELPTVGDAGTIYLVSNGKSGNDAYTEYIYYNNAWEKIGSTDVDLSDYLKSSDVVSITNSEIDTITAE